MKTRQCEKPRGGPQHFQGITAHVPFGTVFHFCPSLTKDTLARLLFTFCRFASTAMSKPKVFMDITADGKPLGRIVIEVSS